MISRNMTLPEVVGYLLPPTARMLDQEVPELQMLCLGALRKVLIQVEESMLLDPFTLGESLHAFAVGFLTTYTGEPKGDVHA